MAEYEASGVKWHSYLGAVGAAWFDPQSLEDAVSPWAMGGRREALKRAAAACLLTLLVSAAAWLLLGLAVGGRIELAGPALGLGVGLLALSWGLWAGQPAAGLTLALSAGLLSGLPLTLARVLPPGLARDGWTAFAGGLALGAGLRRLPRESGRAYVGMWTTLAAITLLFSLIWAGRESARLGALWQWGLFWRFVAYSTLGWIVAGMGLLSYLPEALLCLLCLLAARWRAAPLDMLARWSPAWWDALQRLPLWGCLPLWREWLRQQPGRAAAARRRLAARGQAALAATLAADAMTTPESTLGLLHALSEQTSPLDEAPPATFWRRLRRLSPNDTARRWVTFYGALRPSADLADPALVAAALEAAHPAEQAVSPDEPLIDQVMTPYAWAQRALAADVEQTAPLAESLATLLERIGPAWQRPRVGAMLEQTLDGLRALLRVRDLADESLQRRYVRQARENWAAARQTALRLPSSADRAVFAAAMTHLLSWADASASAHGWQPELTVEPYILRATVDELPQRVALTLTARNTSFIPAQAVTATAASDDDALELDEGPIPVAPVEGGDGQTWRLALEALVHGIGETRLRLTVRYQREGDAASEPSGVTLERLVRIAQRRAAGGPAGACPYTPELAAATTPAWLTRAEAERALLDPVAGRLGYDDEALEAIWRAAAGHSAITQSLGRRLYRAAQTMGVARIIVRDVQTAIADELADPGGVVLPLLSRLSPVERLILEALSPYPNGATLAELRAALGQRGAGPRAATLWQTLTRLERDGLIVSDERDSHLRYRHRAGLIAGAFKAAVDE